MKNHFLILLIFAFAVACSAPKTEEIADNSNIAETTSRQIVKTEKAPLPIGPYNQGIVAGNTLYTAGQIAIDPTNNEMVTANVEVEAVQVLENLKAVIEASEFNMDQVVKTTIYLTDLNDFATVNNIYGSYFKEGNAPARVTVQVASLPKNARMEISMIAVK
jgi:2-iminobutanoate/2-iminopropanoate deaminase